jgi:hypothetical protein
MSTLVTLSSFTGLATTTDNSTAAALSNAPQRILNDVYGNLTLTNSDKRTREGSRGGCLSVGNKRKRGGVEYQPYHQ